MDSDFSSRIRLGGFVAMAGGLLMLVLPTLPRVAPLSSAPPTGSAVAPRAARVAEQLGEAASMPLARFVAPPRLDEREDPRGFDGWAVSPGGSQVLKVPPLSLSSPTLRVPASPGSDRLWVPSASLPPSLRDQVVEVPSLMDEWRLIDPPELTVELSTELQGFGLAPKLELPNYRRDWSKLTFDCDWNGPAIRPRSPYCIPAQALPFNMHCNDRLGRPIAPGLL